ncbi:hypothetical protein [Rhizobium sp. 2YAF20]|uniref:hypothetical protein n=1 Tax=Rhizobium sp. 2YAF20 TaxID=3233027 RepID=UPI003F9CAC11
MRIPEMQPVADRGSGHVRAIANFDLQLTDEVRLYGLRLMQAADGNRFVYAPQAGSRRSATFARPLAEQITAMASELYEGAVTADGQTKTAA